MNLRTPLMAASCLLAFGCAAESELDPSTARTAPDTPFELTIEGVGAFEGRAEYEVSEPAADYVPVPRLVLHGLQVDTASDASVVLRLGQEIPGAIEADYDFPALENAFLVELYGKAYEGRIGAVQVNVDGKLEGSFELESAPVDGVDQMMLKGHFSADRLFLNCNRLATGKDDGSTPGRAGDGSDLIWEPDTRLESSFCASMRAQLGGLYGG